MNSAAPLKTALLSFLDARVVHLANPTPEGAPNNPRYIRKLARRLTEVLVGQAVGCEVTIAPNDDFLRCLEFFLPAALREQYPRWKWESLDGFFVARAKKTSSYAVELVGTAILITDQRLTPFLTELQLARRSNGFVQINRLMIGEPGTGPLGISGPPFGSSKATKLLLGLVARLDSVAWSYVLPHEPTDETEND